MLNIFYQSKNSFEHQLEGEETVLIIRKHWFCLFGPLFVIFLLALIPIVGYFLLNFLHDNTTPANVFWFLTSVYYLFLWNILFYNIMIYLLNTLLITNKRIIENTQAGLFRHTINELSTDKIQDISVQTFGPLAALLGYGNIEIQTAGTQAKFRFTFLPDPQKIKQTIFHTNVPA